MLWLVAPVRRFDWASALERGCQKAEMQFKALASVLGISEAQLTRQKHGAEHLSAQRLDRLADDPQGAIVLEHLLTEWAAFHGFIPLTPVRLWLKLAVKDFASIQMAKAALPRAEEKRTA